MKNLFKCMAIMFVMAFSQAASAQDINDAKSKTPEERAQMQTTWMKDKLALSDAQVNQVSAVNLKYAKINDPVLKGNDSKLSKFKKLKTAHKNKENELKSIFTPAQFTKYLSMQDELKERMKNKKSK